MNVEQDTEEPVEAFEDEAEPETAEPEPEIVEAEIVEEPADVSVRERDLKDQLQRVAAEFANYQKRVQRDKAKWSQDATRGVLTSLMPVLDNLDQAISAFEGDVKDPAVYRQGVELVRKELLHQLKSWQLARIEPKVGDAIDLDAHEAITVVPTEGIDGEQVAFIARPGYKLGEIVLRPAQVGVAKPA